VKHVNEDGTFGIVLNDFDVAREIDQIDERVGKVAFVAPEIGQNGFSHKEDSSKYTVVGKTNYMAPELKKQKYTTAVDIWSAGVVLYELMTLSKATGLQKMESTTEQQIHQNMRRHLQVNTFTTLLIHRC
jgi:serine/threonine protein kinase